jgi:hypothetical protein
VRYRLRCEFLIRKESFQFVGSYRDYHKTFGSFNRPVPKLLFCAGIPAYDDREIIGDSRPRSCYQSLELLNVAGLQIVAVNAKDDELSCESEAVFEPVRQSNMEDPAPGGRANRGLNRRRENWVDARTPYEAPDKIASRELLLEAPEVEV